jgi:ABC-2 type transport system ATP-binding protein
MSNELRKTILSVKEISKRIGKRTIVEGISFDVREGEIFGFLGPNGAGKTTTIRMLVGLIRPSSGSIQVGDYDVQKEFRQAMRQVGCIVENPELYTYLTGWENLEQFARMLGDVPKERIEHVVRLVNLEARIHDRVKTYSLGMKQRLGIAQALLGKPRLLILDEPTNGLDPAGIREMRLFLRNLVTEEHIGVFISSHLLSEVQMLCDRVGIIHRGKMVKVATIDELISTNIDKFEWRVRPIEKAKMLLEQMEGVREVRQEDEERLLCLMSVEHVAACTKRLVEHGVEVFGVRPMVVTLEDLFMELTGGEGIA